MLQAITFPEELIQETGKSPAACLVLPFEPQIKERSFIEGRLKVMVQKAESRLLQQYSYRKALPVLARLQQLVSQVSYHNYKKSIALFATPFRSRLLYLDFPVTETVRTGEDLDIKNVLKAKNNQSHYLLLVLDKSGANLYEGDHADLTLVKQNQWTTPDFLQQVDTGLELVLNAFLLPLFVLGPPDCLEAFRKRTDHTGQIMAFIQYCNDFSNKAQLLAALQPELKKWPMHQQRLVLQKLECARQVGSLNYGIDQVWQAAKHRRAALLAVEDTYVHIVSKSLQTSDRDEPPAWPIMDPLQQLDVVNDAIEKVLNDGGEVALLPPGSLTAFQHIALIEANPNHQPGMHKIIT